MIRRFAHLSPAGLAGRLGLLLLAGLGVFSLVAGLLYQEERHDRMVENFARTLSERMIAVVEVLDRAPAHERRPLVTALADRRLRARLLPGRPQGVEWQPPDRVDEDAAGHLAPLRPRPVLMRRSEARTVDGRQVRPRLMIAVGLGDGTWTEFAVRLPGNPRTGTDVWLGLTALLVVLAIMWGAHRMTRPLRRFAEAADSLGLDIELPPLPDHGPRELRLATRAFNRMTARIRRLVDDRTLLLGAVSHDLKTMLTRLRLRAEFIDDPEQREKATADLDEMQAMLNATLAFARDEATDERPGPVDLAALLRGLTADLAEDRAYRHLRGTGALGPSGSTGGAPAPVRESHRQRVAPRPGGPNVDAPGGWLRRGMDRRPRTRHPRGPEGAGVRSVLPFRCVAQSRHRRQRTRACGGAGDRAAP